jgi:Resolvase, N terminal domain
MCSPDRPYYLNMLIGYARVSTLDQNLDLQREALRKAGCERMFEEKKSGKAGTRRPEFDATLAFLRPEDILVVWKLDRLGSVVKQVAMAAGLRAQILFWSFHGRAKMRGRMPRPARIVARGGIEFPLKVVVTWRPTKRPTMFGAIG